MIFITLGTQDKPFNRLLEAIDKAINDGLINDEVVVQAGCTKYESKNMKIFDLIPMDDFDELMNKADLLITHGGVGSIISGLKRDKKVIAVPRLAKYGEHVNDHQLQIINRFNESGFIVGIEEMDELPNALDKIKSFVPNKYESNTKNMIKTVTDYIDSI